MVMMSRWYGRVLRRDVTESLHRDVLAAVACIGYAKLIGACVKLRFSRETMKVP